MFYSLGENSKKYLGGWNPPPPPLARPRVKKVRGKGGRRLLEKGHLFDIWPWGGRLFGRVRLLERGRLFEEIRYIRKHKQKLTYARASMYISEARE